MRMGEKLEMKRRIVVHEEAEVMTLEGMIGFCWGPSSCRS